MVRDLSVSTLHPKGMRMTYTPPFTRIPRWEVGFWRVFLFTGIFAYPAWVLYHLPDYRGGVGLHKSYLRKQKREEEAAAAAADKS